METEPSRAPLSATELEWEAEFLEYDDDQRIARLTTANAAWVGVKPGGWDERSLQAVLRLGRRLRRWLRLR